MDENDENLKILIIGDSAVGKTCIFRRFSENYFEENFISTIGIDYCNKEVVFEHEGSQVKTNITIWDTAGQERFRTITRNYYKGAHGILLVYDVTDLKSFKNIENWINSIKENTYGTIQVMVIGNKIDVPNRVIKTQEGEKLANDLGYEYKETSAKANIKIDEVFQSIAKKVYLKHFKSQNNNKQFKLTLNDKNTNGGCFRC